MLRLSLPIADGASPRACLEAQIELLISLLDHTDGDVDLEPDVDLEDGHDQEDDRADLEPSLGSLDRATDQRRWNGPDCLNAGSDREAEPYARQTTIGKSDSGPRPKRPAFELLDRERNKTRQLTEQLARTISRIKSRESALAVRS